MAAKESISGAGKWYIVETESTVVRQYRVQAYGELDAMDRWELEGGEKILILEDEEGESITSAWREGSLA